MKFLLKQEKLQELLEKLIVKDIFPSSLISTKGQTLYSIQKEEHGRALRFAKFNKSYFESIDDSDESIELDVERTLGVVKNILPSTVLTVETKGNKLSISGDRINANIAFKEPENKIETSLPFEMKDGIPLIGASKIPLDTIFNIKLADFKNLSAYASSLKTEFYKFSISNKKLIVKVGDLHNFSDSIVFEPESSVVNDSSLEVTYTYAIPQIADTFRKEEMIIKTKTNSPAWIQETTDDYLLGILVPPYVE
jgi:hypothetical protein